MHNDSPRTAKGSLPSPDPGGTMPALREESEEKILARFESLLQSSREIPKRAGSLPPLGFISRDVAQRGGRLQSPLSVTVDLTNQCNQDCLFCYRSGPATLTPDGIPTHLPLESLDSICRQIHRMGVASIALSGGEPACHPQFIDAVSLVKQYDLALTVITNGTRLTERDVRTMGKLLEPERDQVELSVDAASRETFRKIARTDGFSSLLASMEWLQAYRIPFHTMTLILRDNLHEIDEILSLIGRHGPRECAVEAPFPKKGIPSEALASLDEILDVHERLLQRASGTPEISLNFLHLSMNIPGGFEKLMSWTYGNDVPLSGCHGGEASCAIDIHGDMHLCQFLIDRGICRIGNIHETPMAALWKNLQEMKRSIRENVYGGRGGCPGFALEASCAAQKQK